MSFLNQTILNSACLGALFLLLQLGLIDLALHRTIETLGNIAWLLCTMIFIAFVSGWILLVLPELSGWPHEIGTLLSGPLMAAISGIQLSYPLSASKRDAFSLHGWKWSAVVGMALALVLIPFAPPIQRMGAMIITTAVLLSSVALCLRIALQGDPLGWIQAAGTLTGLIAVIAYYREAMGHSMSDEMRWLVAAVVTIGLFMMNMLGRSRLGFDAVIQRRKYENPDYDPVTRLYSAQGIVRMMVKSANRQRWISGEGAVIVVKLLNAEQIARQIGHRGLTTIYVTLANRLVNAVGDVDPVGNYFEGCYLVLIEKVHSSESIFNLVQRIEGQMSEPIFMSPDREAEPIVPRVGIGKSNLSFIRSNVDAALYEAQQEAEGATRNPA